MDRCSGVYRKMHIPDDPLYYEKFYFTPGRHRLPRVEDAVRHDRRADLLGSVVSRRRAAHRDAGRGAALLPHRDRLASVGEAGIRARAARVVGADSAQPRGGQRLLRVRARTASATRSCATPTAQPVNPDGIEFWGQSFIAAPDGSVMARASVDREEVLLADCDLARVEFSRTHWPFLRDRRVDAYGDLTKRFIGADGQSTSHRSEGQRGQPSRNCSRSNRRTAGHCPPNTGSRFPPNGRRHAGTWISWPRPEGHLVPRPLPGVHRQRRRGDPRDHAVRAGPPQRAEHRLRGDRARASGATGSVPTRRVRFHHIRTNECWTRDHGPAFVLRTRRGRTEAAIVDWGYNAWGGKYPPYDADDAVPTRVGAGARAAGVLSRHRHGRRRGRLQRRRHGDDDDVVPAEQESQSGAVARPRSSVI